MLWKQLRDAAGTFFNLGVGGAGLRSQSGVVEVRNSANSAFNPIRASQVQVGSSTAPVIRSLDDNTLEVRTADGANLRDLQARDLNGSNLICTALFVANSSTTGLARKFTISTSPPSSPAVGDGWREINNSNQSLYGWDWEWSGSYWLSPEMYDKVTFNLATQVRHHVQIPNDFDIFVRSLQSAIFCSNTSNGYSFQLTRTNSAEVGTNVGSAISTNANAANTTVKQTSVVNLHIDVSATGCQKLLLLTPAAGTGDFRGSISIVYQLARP